MNTDTVSCHCTLPVSYSIESQKQKAKPKIIYDYKNADVTGLINHIKHFDFESAVFNNTG